MTQNSKILFVTSLLRTSQALGLDTKVKTGTFCAHSLKPVNKYYKVKGAPQSLFTSCNYVAEVQIKALPKNEQFGPTKILSHHTLKPPKPDSFL